MKLKLCTNIMMQMQVNTLHVEVGVLQSFHCGSESCKGPKTVPKWRLIISAEI